MQSSISQTLRSIHQSEIGPRRRSVWGILCGPPKVNFAETQLYRTLPPLERLILMITTTKATITTDPNAPRSLHRQGPFQHI